MADVYVIPTLGQHVPPHTVEQNRWMFGNIPPENKILKHDWLRDGKRLGIVPGNYVEKKSPEAVPIGIFLSP